MTIAHRLGRLRGPLTAAVALAALVATPLAVGADATPSTPAKTTVVATVPPPTVPLPTVPRPTVATSALPAVPTTSSVIPTVPGTPTVSSVPATAPGGSSTTGGATVLNDDTGRITVTVPSSWTDSDTRSSVRDDGGPRPTITASPDLDQWTQTWAVPGMYLVAVSPTIDPTVLISAYTWDTACAEGPITPYRDGRFAGQMQTWSRCGGGATSLTTFAARSADSTYTIYAQIQLTSPDDPALQQIISSIGAVPGANPGEVSAPASPATAPQPVPANLLQSVAAPGSRTVTDETGHLSIAVDPTWTDVQGAPRANDDFSERPHLAVAPIVDDYFSDWSAPGLELWAFPYRSDPYTLVVNRGWPGDCDDAGVQQLNIRGYSGLMQTWANCGGTTSRIISFAVSPADQAVTLYFEIQLPTADDTTLTTALATFAYVPAP